MRSGSKGMRRTTAEHVAAADVAATYSQLHFALLMENKVFERTRRDEIL